MDKKASLIFYRYTRKEYIYDCLPLLTFESYKKYDVQRETCTVTPSGNSVIHKGVKIWSEVTFNG